MAFDLCSTVGQHIVIGGQFRSQPDQEYAGLYASLEFLRKQTTGQDFHQFGEILSATATLCSIVYKMPHPSEMSWTTQSSR